MAPAERHGLRPGASIFTRNLVSTGGVLHNNRSLITYGRKDTRLLPLTAEHFKRTVTTTPSQEESSESDAEDAAAQQARANVLLGAATDHACDSDSELSDAPSASRESPARFPSREKGSSLIAKASSASSPNETVSKNIVNKPSESAPRKTAEQEQGTKTGKRNKKIPKTRPVVQTARSPVRRLPVNELVLVPSPVDNTNFGPPQSSRPGVNTQDPISINSSSPRKRNASLVTSEADDSPAQPPKQPLSALRQRLKPQKLRFKSLSDLRKKRTSASAASATPPNTTRGDGFDATELHISPLARKSVRKRPRQDALIYGFGALQLRSGPLPDVKFEPSSSALQMGGSTAENEAPVRPAHDQVQTNVDGHVLSQRSKRKVSFSSIAREDAIIAQLSSISAPPRPRVVSGYSDSDEDDQQDEEEDAASERDEDVIAKGFEAVADDASDASDVDMPGQNQKSLTLRANSMTNDRPSPMVKTPSSGARLDNKPCMPPSRPRRTIRQHKPMGVTDDMIDIPDSTPAYAQQRLQLKTEPYHPNYDQAPNSVARAPGQLKRPRSILKLSSQIVPDSTTSRLHTAANTRRNSVIELQESNYFTDAMDMIRRADPAKHQIIPRRYSSQQCDVEMLDSNAVVPETSPSSVSKPRDYTSAKSLDILSNQHSEYTSQSLPSVPRDLRSLTRSVSKEHGTLSPSVRRRPSMPFQSPTKTR